MGNILSALTEIESHEFDDEMDYSDGNVFYLSSHGIQVLDMTDDEDDDDDDDDDEEEDSDDDGLNYVYRKNESRLIKHEEIGKGNFGVVYRGTLNGENVAIKEILSGGKTTSQDLKREADIMSNVDHNNIVQFIEVWTDLRYFVIVMEFMENGDLLGFLKNYKTTENVKKGIATDIAEGMRYMEERNIVHRDLSARNVLLDSDLTAKVADFGLARCLSPDYSTYISENPQFPIFWTAPEGFLGTFSSKSDVWSYGILLMEIITEGLPPYFGMEINSPFHLLEELKSGTHQEQPDCCSNELYELMESCWEVDPSDRPDFINVCDELDSIPTDCF